MAGQGEFLPVLAVDEDRRRIKARQVQAVVIAVAVGRAHFQAVRPGLKVVLELETELQMQVGPCFVQPCAGIAQASDDVSGAYLVPLPAVDGGEVGVKAIERSVFQPVFNDDVAAVVAVRRVCGSMDHDAASHRVDIVQGDACGIPFEGLMSMPS